MTENAQCGEERRLMTCHRHGQGLLGAPPAPCSRLLRGGGEHRGNVRLPGDGRESGGKRKASPFTATLTGKPRSPLACPTSFTFLNSAVFLTILRRRLLSFPGKPWLMLHPSSVWLGLPPLCSLSIPKLLSLCLTPGHCHFLPSYTRPELCSRRAGTIPKPCGSRGLLEG